MVLRRKLLFSRDSASCLQCEFIMVVRSLKVFELLSELFTMLFLPVLFGLRCGDQTLVLIKVSECLSQKFWVLGHGLEIGGKEHATSKLLCPLFRCRDLSSLYWIFFCFCFLFCFKI